MDHDVLVIGGGVIGTAILRYLSFYKLDIIAVDKNEDLGEGTTKANSGIVHIGYDPIPGTVKARMNSRGAELMKEESRNLGFDYKVNGAMVVAFRNEDLPRLEELMERGRKNGVKNMRLLSGEEARAREKNLSEEVKGALFLPDSAIVCPFSLTYALAENAVANGASFTLGKKVEKIEKIQDGFAVTLSSGERITTKYLVNAAGVYADEINNALSGNKIHITAKRGNYMLFDSVTKGMFNSTIFQLPGKEGKGVLVTPTVHGNLMIGPTSIPISDKSDTSTFPEDLEKIKECALKTCPSIPFRNVITSFSGLRAHEDGDDFIIGECPDVPGFYNAAGIESPGLSSALAIGEMVASLIAEKAGAERKENPVTTRKPPLRMKDLDMEERNRHIKENPAYGRIVCRCEEISEGEIIDAITGPLGARSLDGVKRRVRAGMGRCQSSFCSPRVMELISQYASIPLENITKNNKGSLILMEDSYDL